MGDTRRLTLCAYFKNSKRIILLVEISNHSLYHMYACACMYMYMYVLARKFEIDSGVNSLINWY